jgi:hypothetical protein
MKLFDEHMGEFCTELKVLIDYKTLVNHRAKDHIGHFEESILKYYHYADLLGNKRFQLAVQEIKHDIACQETYVVFLDKTLKVIRCCVFYFLKI